MPVEDMQQNSERSPEVQIDLIQKAMAAEMSPNSKFVGKPEEYPGLSEAAATAAGVKKVSIFTEMISDSKGTDKGNRSKADFKSMQKKPMVPLSYTQKKAQTVEMQKKAFKPSKMSSRSRFISPTFTERLGLQEQSMGKGAHRTKGMKATAAVSLKIGGLKKKLDQARRAMENPYLNSNGTVNMDFTKDLGRGLQKAEDYYKSFMDRDSVKPEIYKGMGGPPSLT
ncbi:MAG: hypothetical protein V1721_07515 [Pseudomonadota bacterium]